MLRLVGVLAVFASGCRFQFDEKSDAAPSTGDVRDDMLVDGFDGPPLGHDEDGDGIPDTADLCPFIADPTQPDLDGDLVGDACDPDPTNPRQSWLFFTPMMGDAPVSLLEAQAPASWMHNADDWHYIATSSATMRHTEQLGDVDVWVGATFETVVTGGRQAAIIIHSNMAPYWYGEIFDGGGNVHLSITTFDGTSYNALTSNMFGASFPLGDVRMHYTARVSPGMVTLVVDHPTGTTSTMANVAYVGGLYLYLNFGNHSGRVRYVAVVKTN